MALTVNFVNVNDSKYVATIDVGDYKKLGPTDVIQIIRDKGYTAKPTGGTGTTIWKMGKPNGGGDCDNNKSLFENTIKDGDVVELLQLDVIKSPCAVTLVPPPAPAP